MASMLVTFEVSQPERSREVSEVQPSNMASMLVTAGVLRSERPTTEVSEEQP